MKKYNPYYSPTELGFKDFLFFEDPNLSWEYDTLCFWVLPDCKTVLTAQDSGCSCPIPFEDYEGKNLEEVVKKLEHVNDFGHMLTIFSSWNGNRGGEKIDSIVGQRKIVRFLQQNLSDNILSTPEFHIVDCLRNYISKHKG